jgi:hypothetical protein
MLLAPSGAGTVAPGTVTPGAGGTVTPGAVTPGAVTPGAVTPGAVTPGAVTPGAASPGTPLAPPTAAATPTTATPTPVATAVTPTPTTATPTTTATVPASTPAAATCDAAWSVGSSGFVNAPGAADCFQGYAWASASGTGSMITPETFEACGSPCELCASGVVAATDDYSGVALLGFNVAQQESSSTAGTMTPSGSITINVSNAGGSDLRVQLNGSSTTWCKDISGETGAITIPLADFTTECWEGGTPVAYSGGPVEAIVLLVPGSNTDDTMFDICLNSVTPG